MLEMENAFALFTEQQYYFVATHSIEFTAFFLRILMFYIASSLLSLACMLTLWYFLKIATKYFVWSYLRAHLLFLEHWFNCLTWQKCTYCVHIKCNFARINPIKWKLQKQNDSWWFFHYFVHKQHKYKYKSLSIEFMLIRVLEMWASSFTRFLLFHFEIYSTLNFTLDWMTHTIWLLCVSEMRATIKYTFNSVNTKSIQLN